MPNSGDIMPAIERVLSVTRAAWGVNEDVVPPKLRLTAIGHHHAKPVATIPMHVHTRVGGATSVSRVSASA